MTSPLQQIYKAHMLHVNHEIPSPCEGASSWIWKKELHYMKKEEWKKEGFVLEKQKGGVGRG